MYQSLVQTRCIKTASAWVFIGKESCSIIVLQTNIQLQRKEIIENIRNYQWMWWKHIVSVWFPTWVLPKKENENKWT